MKSTNNSKTTLSKIRRSYDSEGNIQTKSAQRLIPQSDIPAMHESVENKDHLNLDQSTSKEGFENDEDSQDIYSDTSETQKK